MKLSHRICMLSSFLSLNIHAAESLKLPLSILTQLPEQVRTKLVDKSNYQHKQQVTPYPYLCRPEHGREVISIKPIDMTSALNISSDKDSLIYTYVDADPSVRVQGTIDVANTQEFLDYLDSVEKQTRHHSIRRSGHKSDLFDALVRSFEEILEDAGAEKLSLEDILLYADGFETMAKWVDVSYSGQSLTVLLYHFVCGNLDCTIRHGGIYTVPQIRWHCQQDSDTCPFDEAEEQEEFRNLTQNELFHFLMVVLKQPSPIYDTLLTEEQTILKNKLLALLPSKQPEA